MKKELRSQLQQAADTMAERKTHISEIKHTADGSRAYKGKRLVSAFLRSFRFKSGAKPVNNFRTLKKAYRRGGLELVQKTCIHYQ